MLPVSIQQIDNGFIVSHPEVKLQRNVSMFFMRRDLMLSYIDDLYKKHGQEQADLPEKD